jgi:nanoRNase/pAp phosphatase (c-di-AMP/oligoRNAs hydrolase)
MAANSSEQNRLEQLRETAGAGPVLILTHANPDPDALASGKALATLLQSAWNVPSQLLYQGLVLRAENRALLNLLTPEWQYGSMPADLSGYSAVALVDTQPGAGNNRLPENIIPQIVIDHHHPLRDALIPVPFADVQPEKGAAVTLLATYLEAAGIDIDSDLATAMFYGLKTDTRGLSRGTTAADISLYLGLLEQIDHSKLVQIEQAGLPQEYFQAFSRGLQAARIHEHSIVANLGFVHYPDLPAEMADLLIRMEKARAVLCLGIHDQKLYLSIRTKPMSRDAGLLVQEIVIPPGKAGGHGTMAGGQIALAGQDAGRLENEIIGRFLQLMGEKGAGESLS